ncbi:MAG TPA: POTRA domain-containing protein [Candidatus Sulfotelmatobacter sp.]|nr:POTRA domain-containing protein [Candidatus Sulfotelmatobacter sp.]
MMRRRRIRGLLAFLLCAPFLSADCAQDHRSNKNAGILVTDFTITGTQAVSATEMARITSDLTGSCFDEDPEEMSERIRALFQDRGYFSVEVKHVGFKPGDPLGVPKPVTMEADVSEGPIYKLADITFLGNHAFSADRLRQAFPLKKGDVFARSKVAAGLESVRQLYGKRGYLDVTFIPDVEPSSNATMMLKVSVIEGTQYRMGKLEILASKEAAGRLRSEWKLPEGTVYDRTYLDKYIDANRDLLPAGFTREKVQMVSDCPHAVVDLKLIVDPAEDKSPQPKDVPCESTSDNPK